MSRPRELRVLLGLARALVSSRAARVRFRDTDARTAESTLDVLALAFDPPRWLAATWSARAGSLRVLALDRVLRVDATRRGAGAPPGGFDAVGFAARRYCEPGAEDARDVRVRLAPPWDGVARALVPTGAVARARGGGAFVRVRATRPEVVGALAASLGAHGG